MASFVQNIPVRRLGTGGPLVPALGFGLMGMSHAYETKNKPNSERFAVLDHAIEIGNTFWDTSDLYGNGENEEMLGVYFKQGGKRDKIFLATKFGYTITDGKLGINSTAAYARQACEASMKRMGIDCIDLFYLHQANPETPIEETMRGLAELKAEGKIKHIGLSAISSTTLRRAVKIAPVAAIQTEYSVFTRDIEVSDGTDLLATARELGVAVVVAMPLGRGILTSRFAQNDMPNDSRPTTIPRFQEANRDANVEIVHKFKAIADDKKITMPQLALAWLLKQGDDIIPIPGTTTIKHLEENWATLSVELSEEENKAICTLSDQTPLLGTSQPPEFKAYLFRDTKEEEK